LRVHKSLSPGSEGIEDLDREDIERNGNDVHGDGDEDDDCDDGGGKDDDDGDVGEGFKGGEQEDEGRVSFVRTPRLGATFTTAPAVLSGAVPGRRQKQRRLRSRATFPVNGRRQTLGRRRRRRIELEAEAEARSRARGGD